MGCDAGNWTASTAPHKLRGPAVAGNPGSATEEGEVREFALSAESEQLGA